MPTPRSCAAARYHFERQLRQKPARFIRSMFCTSLLSRRCSTRRRNAAASSSVRVASSKGGTAMSVLLRPLHGAPDGASPYSRPPRDCRTPAEPKTAVMTSRIKHRRRRRTKIVATLGPSSSSPETLARLFQAGADVFRLNFSHGTHEDHAARLALIRDLEKKTGRPIGVLADVQGPKLRVGRFGGGRVHLQAG